jgi:peptidoglycan/LPS O-acetylase OafA/YrhL
VTELRERGSINLLAFFARRFRRLLPAFFLVVAATLLLGYFFLVPADHEQRALAASAMSAALYVSNWHFALVGSGSRYL